MTEEGFRLACPACSAPNTVPRARLADRPRCGRCGRPLLGGAPVALTAANWRVHLEQSDLPTAVWMWAPWSRACRLAPPDLAHLAELLAERCRLASLDVEQDPLAAAALGVTAVPTAALYRGGLELGRRLGPLGTEGLLEWVRRLLENR